MSRAHSLIARVESMHAVAVCLETHMMHHNDSEAANVALAVASIMADELELLIGEVNDDSVLRRAAELEGHRSLGAAPPVVANKTARRRKAKK